MLTLCLLFSLLSVNMAFLYRSHNVMPKVKLLRRHFSQELSASDSLDLSTPIWPHRFSVAPMMEYTDRYQRFFQRLLTKKSVLYTEMETCYALTHNTDDLDRFLAADFAVEEPLVLQLGGSDPVQMKDAARLAVNYGYKEININCGCPSETVSGKGAFGAFLMKDSKLVSTIAESMASVSTSVPITVKCRIGVDDNDSYEELAAFISTISSQANVKHFIVHARKAILNMRLTPAQNRKIPPLCYDLVYRLVKDFPQLDFTLNGGVTTYEEVLDHYAHGVKGVMVGRSIVDNVFYWRNVDSKLYNTTDPGYTRREILEIYGDYCDREMSSGRKYSRGLMLKPVHNLFESTAVSKAFRRHMADSSRNKEAKLSSIFNAAISNIPAALLDQK